MSSGVTAEIDAQLMLRFMNKYTDKAIPLISLQWSIDVQKADIGNRSPRWRMAVPRGNFAILVEPYEW